MPALYADLRLKFYSNSNTYYRLFLLLRTLLQNPGLPPLVKSLILIDTEHPRESPATSRASRQHLTHHCWEDAPSLTEQDKSLLRKALLSPTLPPTDQWTSALENDQVAKIILPLILWQTQNLRKLSLDYNFHAPSELLRVVMTHVAKFWSTIPMDPAAPFPYLQQVTFAAPLLKISKDDAPDGSEHIQSLFFLPAVEKIKAAFNLRKWPGLTPFINDGFSIRTQSLRILEFQRSEINLDSLHKLILVCPSLATLRYEWWRDLDDVLDGSNIFMPEAFMEAISPSKHTLRELSLTISFYCITFDIGIDPGWYGIQGSVADLREWQQLENLRIPLLILLGAETADGFELPTFPHFLKELIITEDGLELDTYEFEPADVQSALQKFLADWRSMCPGLGAMTIEVSEPSYNDIWSDDLEAAVKSRCEEAGIAFRISTQSISKSKFWYFLFQPS